MSSIKAFPQVASNADSTDITKQAPVCFQDPVEFMQFPKGCMEIHKSLYVWKLLFIFWNESKYIINISGVLGCLLIKPTESH